MAFWLIHHVQDPQHWARMTVPANARPIGPPAARQVLILTVRNDSRWMDLCPVLFARVAGPRRGWTVHFRVAGRDVTRKMTREGGLSFVGGLRLWPGQRRQVQVVFECKTPAASVRNDIHPVTVQIGLRPNPSARRTVNQRVTLRPRLTDAADRVASRQ